MRKNTLNLRSYAKINLSLDVLGKTDNGYHQLCMMMQTVSLHDDIQITKTRRAGEIELACNSPYVPCDEKNIAYKAAHLLFDTYPEATNGFGVFIRIEKRIPVAAGLAGGSGNAAAVLHGINRLFQLHLSIETLCALGVTLGADVHIDPTKEDLLARVYEETDGYGVDVSIDAAGFGQTVEMAVKCACGGGRVGGGRIYSW